MKIRPIDNNNRKRIINIIKANKIAYGRYDPKKDCCWLFATQVYEVDNELGELMGFFGLSYYSNIEVVLNLVYVIPKFRGKGIFNKIVKFAKQKTVENGMQHLTIASKPKNKVADEIYKRKFEFLEYNSKLKCNWYEIKC